MDLKYPNLEVERKSKPFLEDYLMYVKDFPDLSSDFIDFQWYLLGLNAFDKIFKKEIFSEYLNLTEIEHELKVKSIYLDEELESEHSLPLFFRGFVYPCKILSKFENYFQNQDLTKTKTDVLNLISYPLQLVDNKFKNLYS